MPVVSPVCLFCPLVMVGLFLTLQFSPHQVGLLKRAMRYYRLWIYACNAAMFAAAAAFATVAACLLTDSRRSLLPQSTLPLHHPALLYAYVALAVQGGVLQVIGCVGAIRLNERFLHIYWLILAALLCGDLILGLVFVLRLSKVGIELRPALRQRIASSYAKDKYFTNMWDALQQEERCCGATSPSDFNISGKEGEELPKSCCGAHPEALSPPTQMQARVYVIIGASTQPPPGGGVSSLRCSNSSHPPWKTGCAEVLHRWLRKTAERLLILGFCVLTFVKLCFAVILRYEIREMIHKIRALRGEEAQVRGPDLAAALGLNLNPSPPSACPHPRCMAPGPPPLSAYDTSALSDSEADAHSHCALILEADSPPRIPQGKHNGNNNFVEMKDLRITSSAT